MLQQHPAPVKSLPPSSNTGGKSPPVSIDWLSFTVSADYKPCDLVAMIGEWFGSHAELQTSNRGMFGFTQSAAVVVPIEGEAAKVGVMAWGGESQRGVVYVSLPGSACSLIAPERWQQVHADLSCLGARLSRVDLACDDLEGAYSVDVAAEWYRAGDFNAGGRRPSHTVQGPWLDPEQTEGRTLYLGKFVNGKCLCVYEKGKQLGDASSPWVRWELRLGSKDRVLPLELLVNPAQYFAGGYTCLQRVVEVAALRIATVKVQLTKSLERLVTYAKRSYGRLVHVLLQHHAGDVGAVVDRLLQRGCPASLSPSWIAATAGAARGTL